MRESRNLILKNEVDKLREHESMMAFEEYMALAKYKERRQKESNHYREEED